MARRMSRRTFITASVATGSVAAAGGLFTLLSRIDEGGTPVPDQTPVARSGTPVPIPVIAGPADGYIAVAPRALRSGRLENISLSLFRGDRPASDRVTVALFKDGRSVSELAAQVDGHGLLSLPVPAVAEGEYQLKVNARSFADQATIRVEDGTLVFVETDKPIYKPGQTVHIRVLALDPALRPASGEATVEVLDAKGIKIFKKVAAVDDFGMASVDLPLATELNLGVWKVLAALGRRSAQLDIRVERYVLPKYEVTVTLPQEWALVNQPISGTVGAEYSFGKPVKGEVEIVAERYVGTWEQYARVSQPLDGRRTFELPPVGYAAGSPEADGQAHVRLEVTVREQATGYEESTSRLVTIAASPVTLKVIPETVTFKPSLPLNLLVVAETPDQQPVDADVELEMVYQRQDGRVSSDSQRVRTIDGLAEVTLAPPSDAVSVSIEARSGDAVGVAMRLRSGHSPSGIFVQLSQLTRGPLKVGDSARFQVRATREAGTFYYEVVARGMVVYSDFTREREIELPLTPAMAPEARLLVYQVLPNTSEVAADYLPFTAEGSYPHQIEVDFEHDEVRPGDELGLAVQTQGPARVGLAAVDRSVFILAENRVNLRQVFDDLERLYQKPQIELHEARPLYPDAMQLRPPMGMMRGFDMSSTMPGAKEMFEYAGLTVLTNRTLPAGKSLPMPMMRQAAGAFEMAAGSAAAASPAATAASADEGLAEVQRVRQFFPETWIWDSLTTENDGRASQRVTAPDSITTWMVRAVALSKEHGLGIAEAQLRVFQPFFVQVDLPYAVTRREELPLKVALYNYASDAQEFTVDLEPADWFDILDEERQTVTVEPNSVGALSFPIRPTGLGVRGAKITARSRVMADAIIKEVIVEPEGVQRELVENLVLSPGTQRTVELAVPAGAIDGSARALLTLTGNVLSQTIEGLEGLLQMPFGCGEQNMILFAPNVFIARYLEETRQLKPEVMAKAELMMLTGYQRELIYRRSDGSFSAFGEQDQIGSLWLTAFVLKTFAQARDLIFIDDAVLATARDWIKGHQKPDGSFEPVGFVHHEEMLGGLQGTTALTAYLAIALREAGDTDGAGRAEQYLESRLDATDDAYGLAIMTYALALAGSPRAQAARDKLMQLAQESADGLHWGDVSTPMPGVSTPLARSLPVHGQSAAIETTGYGLLALLQLGDRQNAGRVARWLAAQRNPQGGFGSTQDTVVALQGLTALAGSSLSDIDASVALRAGSWRKDVRIPADNADVLQIIELPSASELEIDTQGKGQVQAQVVRRYNLPAVEAAARSAFTIDVRYGSEQVAVDDLITIDATVTFTPPEPIAAGMVVLDLAIPTGFEAVAESLEALPASDPKIKRYDTAGRKVVLYIEDMLPNDRIQISFQARALYPVKAQAVGSQAYAYYRPEWKGEVLAGQLTVGAAR